MPMVEAEQSVVCVLITRVGRGCQEQHVPFFVGCKTLEQFIALVLAFALVATDATVRLVHDYHSGASARELVPPVVGLDVVKADDGMRSRLLPVSNRSKIPAPSSDPLTRGMFSLLVVRCVTVQQSSDKSRSTV